MPKRKHIIQTPHSENDQIESLALSIQSRLELIGQLQDVFKTFDDNLLQLEIANQKQRIVQDIKQIMQYGNSYIDIIAQFGSRLLKAELLNADTELTNYFKQNGEYQVQKFVSDDNDLIKRYEENEMLQQIAEDEKELKQQLGYKQSDIKDDNSEMLQQIIDFNKYTAEQSNIDLTAKLSYMYNLLRKQIKSSEQQPEQIPEIQPEIQQSDSEEEDKDISDQPVIEEEKQEIKIEEEKKQQEQKPEEQFPEILSGKFKLIGHDGRDRLLLSLLKEKYSSGGLLTDENIQTELDTMFPEFKQQEKKTEIKQQIYDPISSVQQYIVQQKIDNISVQRIGSGRRGQPIQYVFTGNTEQLQKLLQNLQQYQQKNHPLLSLLQPPYNTTNEYKRIIDGLKLAIQHSK